MAGRQPVFRHTGPLVPIAAAVGGSFSSSLLPKEAPAQPAAPPAPPLPQGIPLVVAPFRGDLVAGVGGCTVNAREGRESVSFK